MICTIYENFKRKRNRANLNDEAFSFLFDEDLGKEYVVYDTETTGLSVKNDEILSIGAVKIRDNKILTSETFEVYVKNLKDISTKSIEIHGIRPCDLEDAKDAEEAIKAFLHFIGSRTLIGYYLEFDVGMVNKYTKEMLGIKLPNKMLEVSEIYHDKEICRIPQGNIDLRFDTILKKYDVPNMGVHNAVNDAIMTAMIYLKLTKGK
ncbi:MAG: DNA polymerase-3 subunit epsilon [Clostridium sp.]|jgi:DNA polymerase-3 subunit epsilon